MIRILLLLVLVWILYQIIKRFLAAANQANNPTAANKPAEKIVQCVQCGCHVVEAESQLKDNKIYCKSPDCNKQDDSTPNGD
jgi:hypothetical protein